MKKNLIIYTFMAFFIGLYTSAQAQTFKEFLAMFPTIETPTKFNTQQLNKLWNTQKAIPHKFADKYFQGEEYLYMKNYQKLKKDGFTWKPVGKVKISKKNWAVFYLTGGKSWPFTTFCVHTYKKDGKIKMSVEQGIYFGKTRLFKVQANVDFKDVKNFKAQVVSNGKEESKRAYKISSGGYIDDKNLKE
ncbi:hypothetical protein BKI52_03165 [marine bacterium AO1-C]|nr:hypothetical protein BKI52_03165 [marine bacterium AO1-C]